MIKLYLQINPNRIKGWLTSNNFISNLRKFIMKHWKTKSSLLGRIALQASIKPPKIQMSSLLWTRKIKNTRKTKNRRTLNWQRGRFRISGSSMKGKWKLELNTHKWKKWTLCGISTSNCYSTKSCIIRHLKAERLRSSSKPVGPFIRIRSIRWKE